MMRILQISDTHMSPGKRHFAANWQPLRDWIIGQDADLVIHTGDVTVDGADREDDMAYCAGLLHDLGMPVLCVPGNHDVGEPHHPHQPVNDARIARWRRHFGNDWWMKDVEDWRLIGLDAMLFGSGLAQEAEQLAWLQAAMTDGGTRKIGWFMHRPLFLEGADEADTGYWSVKPALRAPLLQLVQRHAVALVATGHLHKSHDCVVDGCRYLWCGSSAFVVGPDNQPEMPGEKRLGGVTYDFDGSSVRVAATEIVDLTRFWIDDVLHEVYPPRQPVGSTG
ncbi:MAG: metallophosphoesterase [Betaproteobacteria bacterium]